MLLLSFLVGPWVYNYYESHWTNRVNATHGLKDVDSFPDIHTTDVTERKALDMLDDAAERGNQFYMQIAPGKAKRPCLIRYVCPDDS